jgi:NADH-quinone oxidoreductase subunit G
VLRVLANMLGLPGFEFESAQEVLLAARGEKDIQATHVQGGELSNATIAAVDMNVAAGQPVSAAIYQLDCIVRRAPSLQLTADGKAGRPAAPAAVTKSMPEGVPA